MKFVENVKRSRRGDGGNRWPTNFQERWVRCVYLLYSHGNGAPFISLIFEYMSIRIWIKVGRISRIDSRLNPGGNAIRGLSRALVNSKLHKLTARLRRRLFMSFFCARLVLNCVTKISFCGFQFKYWALFLRFMRVFCRFLMTFFICSDEIKTEQIAGPEHGIINKRFCWNAKVEKLKVFYIFSKF